MRWLRVVVAVALLGCGAYRSTGRTEDVRAGTTVISSPFEPAKDVTLDAAATLTGGALDVRVLANDVRQGEAVRLDATHATATVRFPWRAGAWRFEVTASSDAAGTFDVHLSDR